MKKIQLLNRPLYYRIQQFIIVFLHFILLSWMYHFLSKMGDRDPLEVFFHFLGMSIFGGSLIFSCSKWALYHHKKASK